MPIKCLEFEVLMIAWYILMRIHIRLTTCMPARRSVANKTFSDFSGEGCVVAGRYGCLRKTTEKDGARDGPMDIQVRSCDTGSSEAVWFFDTDSSFIRLKADPSICMRRGRRACTGVCIGKSLDYHGSAGARDVVNLGRCDLEPVSECQLLLFGVQGSQSTCSDR